MLLLALLQQTVFGSNPWEQEVYRLNAPGTGSGRCELGFDHQIFDRDECEFAIKDLGYEVKTISTFNNPRKVCGCSYNPNTKHMQYNTFSQEDYCYVSSKNCCTHEQDVNSSGSSLIALCYVKGGASDKCMAEAAAKPEGAAKRPDFEKGCEFASVVSSKSQCLASCAHVTAAPTDCCECNGTCGQCDCAYCKYFCEKYFEEPSVEAVYNADGFALNVGGIGSGRCEDGYETQIFSEADCEKGIESLGYQIATRTNLRHWGEVCGCSFNAETGHMQFNGQTSKHICYPTADNKHLPKMQLQDRRSREKRLVAICYSAPPTPHPTAVPTGVPTLAPTSVPTAVPTQGCVPTPDLEWGRLMSGNKCVIADIHGDLSLRECTHGSVNKHTWSLKDGLLRALPAGKTTWNCALNHNKWPKLRACSGASNQDWTYDCDGRLSSVTDSLGTLCMGLLPNGMRLYMKPCDAESVVFRLESTTGRRLDDENTLLRRLQF